MSPISLQTDDFEKFAKILYVQQVMCYSAICITILNVHKNIKFDRNPFSKYGYEIWMNEHNLSIMHSSHAESV
jgi:hypothetical protein